jgi:hypothetical protein
VISLVTLQGFGLYRHGTDPCGARKQMPCSIERSPQSKISDEKAFHHYSPVGVAPSRRLSNPRLRRLDMKSVVVESVRMVARPTNIGRGTAHRKPCAPWQSTDTMDITIRMFTWTKQNARTIVSWWSLFCER